MSRQSSGTEQCSAFWTGASYPVRLWEQGATRYLSMCFLRLCWALSRVMNDSRLQNLAGDVGYIPADLARGFRGSFKYQLENIMFAYIS